MTQDQKSKRKTDYYFHLMNEEAGMKGQNLPKKIPKSSRANPDCADSNCVVAL